MKKASIVLFLALLMASPLWAGVVFEIESTYHDRVESTATSVEGRKLKMEIASKDQRDKGEMIYRGDRREMVVVDHDEKSYVVMDEQTMKEIAGQVGAAMQQMEEALKNVPESQRAMVEKMMKQRMPPQAQQRPQSELVNTGERATHRGYPCVKYEVRREGQKVRELWVTDWSRVEGGKEVAGAFEEMAEFFREMLDAFSTAAGPAGGFVSEIGDNAFEHMKEIGGFPVVTREFAGDGSLEGETTLRSARRQTLDPDVFEPPAGYKRKEMLPGR